MKVIDTVCYGAVVAFVVMCVFLLERAQWRECRRVHPWWYCAADRGRGK